MNETAKTLDLLFQKPLEPIFTTRDNGKAAFDLPDSYYTERYNSQKLMGLLERNSQDVETKIPLPEIRKLPNLKFTEVINPKQQFSLFNDTHRVCAGNLIKIFLEPPNVRDFAALCAYTKDRVNPILFQYCYAVAVGHRPDTRNVNIPSIVETFPTCFVEPSILRDARAEAALVENPGNRTRIDIPRNYTASDREDEQRVAYWREDIGINAHHWHWHLVYPGSGPLEVVRKDRRGELFFYMHQQIMARYNLERFCNNLGKVVPLNNFREVIPEGYFPKILSSVSNRTYPGRISHQMLRDINRPDNKIEIAECDRWRDRILAAIDQGYVVDSSGRQFILDEIRGVDLLGDILEASDLTINRQFYGNLHNMGHNLISLAHDPEGRHLEDMGVMADVTTAMRDPAFYRLHTMLDNIFLKHKALLPPYEESHLNYPAITIVSLETRISSKNARPNTWLTFLQKSAVDLAAGLDFGAEGNVFASFTHLQHANFEYNINVTNASSQLRVGTARIFLIPKADERGRELNLEEQRILAIELDKFTVKLQPGQNILRRRSDESSLTIPFERTFRRVGAQDQPTDAGALAAFRFCGCGWPQHLLLPKGKPEGMAFDLFVMISDYANDEVKQTDNSTNSCDDAASFCGLKDKLYPDKRSMGYPFDRKLQSTTLESLVSDFSNMKTQEVRIVYNDILVDKN